MPDPSPLHELTNGRYHVKITPAGGGQSMLEWIALNRWSGDAVEDSQGFFIYLRDVEDGRLWSAGLQPALARPDQYSVSSSGREVAIERLDHGIRSTMTVSIDGTDDLEMRRVVLTNESSRVRRIEMISCIEVALAHPAGDLGHPAFSKLFVQTEWLAECGALVAKRRPRAQGERWPAMFHAMTGAAPAAWETDRLRFIGRGRSLVRPAFVMQGTVGNVLDPMFCLATAVELAAGETREIGFLLGAVRDHQRVRETLMRFGARGGNAAGSQSSPAPGARPKGEAEAKLHHFNGHGGFSEDGGEYLIRMPWQGDGLLLPPMPWCNVIANERFGFITSETGAGCTWSRNSQANRLTPWSNDPVCDPHGEALYLRDEATGAFWSPLPGPCPAQADYEMAHGFGSSQCRVIVNEIEHETTLFVPRSEPLKIIRLRLRNAGGSARRLSFFSFHRLVLGTLPPGPGAIRTSRDGDALLAWNAKNADFSDGTTTAFGFVRGTAVEKHTMSCSRRGFIGLNRSLRSPKALEEAQLDGVTGTAEDACFAHQWTFELPADGGAECVVLLGETTGDEQRRDLVRRYGGPAPVNEALGEVTAFWRELLGRVRVTTPSPGIDLMVNGWLPYQAVACRMWGRTAFYQSSGALGFRDQLQDAGNLSLLWPGLARSQIRLHARRQFAEGDVLHWWHEEPVGRGVRTRFSDDLLWLPFVTGDYVRATGDAALLDEMEPFLEAPLLKPGEDENYLKPAKSGKTASIYEHCCLAIERSLTEGAHGLPLMGAGDWNDGMNRVGREGRGESVWLGFFLFEILGRFIPLAESRGDGGRAARWADYRGRLHAALDEAGWDGGWYRRAYYDDGTPLGTRQADECRIDGLAQSWAVLSGAASPARAKQAMMEAERQLADGEGGIIRLLTPPFENAREDPGYIKGYVAGVRENGGQYTHAACWMVGAMAELGRRDRAARWLEMLSPLSHTRAPGDVGRYKAEPYVIAADVYGAPPHVGRGGWTWYTGSAGWAWRVALEPVLGLRMENGGTLVLRPCVPDEWPSYRIDCRCPETHTLHRIEVLNPHRCSECVVAVTVDGLAAGVVDGAARFPLFRDGHAHDIAVTLGRAE